MRTQLSSLIPCIVALLAAGCRRGEQEPAPPPVAAVHDAGPRALSPSELSELGELCEHDASAVNASPYAKTPGAASPVVYLRADLGATNYRLQHPNELWPWRATKVAQAQLVACANIVRATKVRDCPLDGAVIELYTATTLIRVLEARTGKELARHTLEHVAGACPRAAWMIGDRSRDYGDLDVEVTRAVAPLQPADAPLPQIAGQDLDAACLGKPAVGGAPFRREKGAFNAYAVFEREGDAPFEPVGVADAEVGKPEWFQRNLAASSGQREHVSLVVCLTATRGKGARTCTYSGDKALRVHDATWRAVAVDPSTGATRASAEVTARPRCPSLWSFEGGAEILARPDLTAMLAPLVEPAP